MIHLVAIDKQSNLKILRKLLVQCCPDVALSHEFTSTDEAIKMLSLLDFQILFLGIPLDELHVHDLLSVQSDKAFQIIATEDVNTLQIDHFQKAVGAVLSVPVTKKELSSSLRHLLNSSSSLLPVSENEPSNFFCKSDNLIINCKNRYQFIPFVLIKYCKASSSYTEIYYKNELYDDFEARQGTPAKSLQVSIASHSLSYYEILMLPKGFIRIHSAYLVNKKYIRFIDKHADTVILDDGTALPISRNRMDDLLKAMI